MGKSLLPILALSVASVLPAALALPRPDISASVAQANFLDVGANVNMGNLSFPDLECAFQEQAACVSHGGDDDTDSNGGDESGDANWPTKSINDFQLDPSFQIRVNSTSCGGGDNTTQIFDALAEMRQAVFNATTVLLQDPLAENNRLYWGSPSTGDLSTPIGVLGQVLYSSKNDVSITCEEDTKQECSDAAKAGGAYVDKDSGTIHLCGSVFAGCV